MPSPSPRVDMNFAMQNGLVDQAALDAAFGDNKVPVASGNGVHVMGLTDDGSGIIIRWRQDRNGGSSGNGAWGDTPNFGAYYNNDAVNPAGHSSHLEPRTKYGQFYFWGGSVYGRIASSIADPTSTQGVYQTYLWMPVYGSRRFVPELFDPNNPSRRITDFGPNNGEIGYRIDNHHYWCENGAAGPHWYAAVNDEGWSYQGGGWAAGFREYRSMHQIFVGNNPKVDVPSMGTTLKEVVDYIDDPNFEYVINVYGRATWTDGAMNAPTHEMVRLPASALHVPPMQLVYPVAGLAVSDSIMVYKNGKLILPASYTVASEEITFTEEGVSIDDKLDIIKVK